MKPLLNSPRFDFRACSLQDVSSALKTIGHAVLDNVWNTRYLAKLHDLAEKKFQRDDALFEGRFDEHPRGTIEVHLGGFTDIYALGGVEEMDAEFFLELERAGLPACYRNLAGGDFVVSTSERVIRRVDPRYPLRFAGLHCDGQLHALSEESGSDRQITLWTPLQDCADDRTPRLLLLKRGATWLELFGDRPLENGALPIQLKPVQLRDESTAAERALEIEAQFKTLFASRECFAPLVPLGSAVLFDRDIWHGSYIRPGMTTPRFSLDFRVVHDYRVTKKNAMHGGQLFRRQGKGLQHGQESTARKLMKRISAVIKRLSP